MSTNKYSLVIDCGPDIVAKIDRGVNVIVNRGITGPPGADGTFISPSAQAVVDTSTINISAGKQVLSIAIVPTGSTRTLSVGYSAGTGELIDNEPIDANDSPVFYIGRYFHTAKTLHFSGFTGSVLIYIL